ncbi:MAG: rRNA maturation RNase YbeY [Clostridia bacterium]|nr:rRNA maturation RNase YbeY [Clostridia bacterium]
MAKAKAKVTIENKQKVVAIPSGTRMLIRRCCEATLQTENFPELAEIDVSFVDNEQIHELNLQFRQVDRATDVLSFPLGENGEYDHNPETGAALLGDVVLSFERAQEQAAEFGHSLQREVGYLTVHSVLHLLGYDHVNGGLEAVRMREKEETVMAKLGLSREDSFVEKPEE